MTSLSRRDALRLGLSALVVSGIRGQTPNGPASSNVECLPIRDLTPNGELLGTLPFSGADRNPPFHTLLDAGLDARLYTDLSTLAPEALVTPNEKFFIRTAFPDLLDRTSPWTIRVGGLVKQSTSLSVRDLEPLAESVDPFVMECAGNNDPANFGLMSAAKWRGVPIAKVLHRIGPLPKTTHVQISGFDRHSQPALGSKPGASWVFRLDDLLSSRALLALRMNDQPLPRDHGFPVRLIVPGWYGCTCIKWVDEISLVDNTTPATPHMQEFAARTHQDGVPKLARDFRPAAMDLSAFPVRIEKWRVSGKLVYRAIGIMWGGSKLPSKLLIRMKDSEPYLPVDVCAVPPSPLMWTLWSYLWRPAEPGRYQIVMKVDDPTIPTRRLDLYFYARQVWIDEI